MPQIDPIFSSRPPDQTTSWIQITRLDQTRPDRVFRTDHLKRPASSDLTRSAQLSSTDHPARPSSSHKRPSQARFLSRTTQPGQLPLKFLSQQHITTVHPASTGQDAIVSYVSQVRTILCVLGHGRLIYKALDEPYKANFPHTFGLKSLDFLFRLYLIVGRVASGVPWAVKGLPYPFSIVGLLCRYLVSDWSSAFQKQFRPRLGVCSCFRRIYFVVSPSSMLSSLMRSPA